MFGDTLGLVLPSLPWGFQWCDAIQREWPRWRDILQGAMGGSGKGPPIRDRLFIPCSTAGGLQGLWLGFSGCLMDA